MVRKQREKLKFAAAVCFWLAVWQAAAMAVNHRLLLPIPTPVTCGAAFLRLSADIAFWRAVLGSFGRILAGFVAALLLGCIGGVLSARSTNFRLLASPLLALVRSVPVASMTIVIFLWISREKIPSVISFITVLPVVWTNVERGAGEIDRPLLEMARVFGMRMRDVLLEIVLPGMRPYIAAAVTSGIGFAWKSGVAAEVICRTAVSLGDLLWAGKAVVDYDEVFAVTGVIVVLAVLLEKAAAVIMRGRSLRQSAAADIAAGVNEKTEAAGDTALSGVQAEKEADVETVGRGGQVKTETVVKADGSVELVETNAAGKQTASLEARQQRDRSLRLENVSFGYGRRKKVLSDFSLSLPSGSRLCLTGPSGCGKTSVLRLVLGLERADGGSIEGREGLSFSAVFQEDRLIPWRSVLANCAIFSDASAARRMLTAMGLSDSMDLLPGELSGGMRRRAALARALAHPSDVLVLDEAFTGLDADTRDRVLAVVRECLGDRSLLMVTHDEAEAEALGAEIVRMSAR